MIQAFMSHASKDAIFADLVRMKLKEAGIQVWIDRSALRAGEEWRNAIDGGISSSDVLLAVITPQSCASPYVTYEWAFALGKGIKVIPLLLEDAEIHPRLEVLQWLDFRNHKVGPWEALTKEIVEHCAASKARGASTYVGNMTVDQLQDLIGSALSLATATAKSSNRGTAPEDISQAAKDVVDVMQHAKDKANMPSGRPQRRRMLWVDDRPANNIYERSAFEAMGFDFTLASSTDEALRVLSDQRFDGIISDMGRREGLKEGYVLLDAVRRRGDRTPFFIYTGSSSPEQKREAAAHGAQGSTNHPQELFKIVTQSVM